jgi:hypothetical protein
MALKAVGMARLFLNMSAASADTDGWHPVYDFWFPPGSLPSTCRLPPHARGLAGGTTEDLPPFARLVDAAERGDLDPRSGTARGQLSLILVLDQFPRVRFLHPAAGPRRGARPSGADGPDGRTGGAAARRGAGASTTDTRDRPEQVALGREIIARIGTASAPRRRAGARLDGGRGGLCRCRGVPAHARRHPSAAQT